MLMSRALLVAGASLAVVASCSGDDDSTMVTASPNFTTTLVPASAAVPDGFPSEIPLPSDLVLEEATRMENDGNELFDLTGWIDGDPIPAGRAYLAELEALGYEVTSETEGATSVLFIATGPDGFVSAGFYPDPVRNVGTSVGITVGPAP